MRTFCGVLAGFLIAGVSAARAAEVPMPAEMVMNCPAHAALNHLAGGDPANCRMDGNCASNKPHELIPFMGQPVLRELEQDKTHPIGLDRRIPPPPVPPMPFRGGASSNSPSILSGMGTGTCFWLIFSIFAGPAAGLAAGLLAFGAAAS